MIFPFRIGRVFHVKSSCLLWFDLAILRRLFAVVSNTMDQGDMKVKPPAASKVEEGYQLRLLYTQHLQWRLVNAHAGAALSLQTTAAEVSDRVGISVLLGQNLRHDMIG